MDTRPIGVFDSGLGGLTTVKKLAQLLPGEDIIYLGDTGRVPYGSRSRETIIKYARQDAAFLAEFSIKTMVIACNTVCSTAFEVLSSTYDMPVYEVVKTPARVATERTKTGKIGVIGTKATIRSRAYETAIKRHSPYIEVLSAACPLFVPLVENGRTESGDIVALTLAEEYLSEIRVSGVDTLILGCTHYPLLKDVISGVMGPGVALIDSGAETARLVAHDLTEKNMLSPDGAAGRIKYFVTDSASDFSQLASLFLEADVDGSVEQVSLE